MNWKSEWKPLAWVTAVFLVFFYLPVGSLRFDNAVTESFNATIKKECIYVEPIKNFDHAYGKVFNFIEMFYNSIRLHSFLEYQSPAEFEQNRKS